MIPDVTQLWNEIGKFDKNELDNSKDMTDTRWEARESARMEAYNKLFYRQLECSTVEKEGIS